MRNNRTPDAVPSGEALLTLQEACRLLRIGVRAWQRHVAARMPAVRIGRRLLYRREDVLAFAAAAAADRGPDGPSTAG